MNTNRFLRNGWKVGLVTLTIAMIIITSMFALSLREPKVTKAEVDKIEVETLVKKAALIFATAVPHDKTLSSSATVTELNITDGGIEAIVNTECTVLLDYKSPYDEPYLKGKTQWLAENKTRLTTEEINVAETEIKIHEDWVKWEMEVPSGSNATYKLTAANLQEARNGNFTLYLWTDIDRALNGTLRNWIPNNIFIPTDADAEKEAYESFGDTVKQLVPAYEKAEQTVKERAHETLSGPGSSFSPATNGYDCHVIPTAGIIQ
ncbi:hypothetical protein [Coprothermobacter platensis]|uniref:hypothetical protein n=1 Tax=Coprothermobacter platensis TaxID=108819 RepID=UPI000376D247|nr:hypothetical protein [Coprothermobacter platensis]